MVVFQYHGALRSRVTHGGGARRCGAKAVRRCGWLWDLVTLLRRSSDVSLKLSIITLVSESRYRKAYWEVCRDAPLTAANPLPYCCSNKLFPAATTREWHRNDTRQGNIKAQSLCFDQSVIRNKSYQLQRLIYHHIYLICFVVGLSKVTLDLLKN